jgi:hypothetical protein
MEVYAQLNAQAALSPGKESPESLGLEIEWAPEQVWTTWSGQKALLLSALILIPLAFRPVGNCYSNCAIPAPYIRSNRVRVSIK